MPNDEQSPFEPLDSSAPWIVAGFEGVCSRDFDTIYEGDVIRADGEGGWEKKECVDEDEDWIDYPPPLFDEAARYPENDWFA